MVDAPTKPRPSRDSHRRGPVDPPHPSSALPGLSTPASATATRRISSQAWLGSLRRRGRQLALGLGLGLASCWPQPPAAPPAEAVTSFYAAVAAGDCTRALGLLGGGFRRRVAPQGSCEHLFDALQKYPLEGIIDTNTDGRNRDAQLVRARLRGKTTDVIIRVQAEGSRWRIFSL